MHSIQAITFLTLMLNSHYIPTEAISKQAAVIVYL